MLIQDRIRLILKANQMNSSQFADRVGVNRASLSHVLSGRNKPSHDFLSKIIKEFPNVNASWLITGETRDGDFKDEKGEPKKDTIIKQKTEEVTLASKTIVKVIHYYADGTFDTFLPNA